ncbi:MAG TPA: trigger factor [Chloroflexota bacterium]|nr:trigger factor [Chloroflexota bacterium]
MKVSTQEIEKSQVVLEVEVEPPRLERAMDQAYRRMAGRLKVPGFRPGKAPRPLVERMVGRESLLEDAIEHLVPEVYREAIDQENLYPIEEASFEVVEAEPLKFKATVPVRPAVQLGDYRALRRELTTPEVTDEQVDHVINQLRESHATWVPVERPVQLEDRVAMDVHGAVDEKVILDRQDVEYVVRGESDRPMPGFAEQLVGMAAGDEKTFTLAVPADFEDAEIAGKQATFTVKVHWVKEKQLPELDDAFASSVGTFSTLDEVKQEVRGELQARAEANARQELQEGLINEVVEGATLELPPQAIEKQAERLRQQLASSLDRQGITVEQYRQLTGKSPAEFEAELEADARRELTRLFVLDEIAKAEQIEVDPVEVETEIRKAAGEGPEARRLVREALARRETRARVEAAIRERKTIARLVEMATGATDGETAEPTAAPSEAAEPAAEEPSHA